MRKTMTMFGAIMIASIITTGCGGDSNENKETTQTENTLKIDDLDVIAEEQESMTTEEEQLPVIKAKPNSTEKYVDWGARPVDSEDGPSEMWTMHSMMCEGPLAEIVKASTVLAPQGKLNYSEKNICDDDPTTAWVEGNSDYGIGEYIEFNNWSIMGDGEISILNGYQSTKSSWENNSRVKSFMVSLNGVNYFIVDLADVMGVQTFKLSDAFLEEFSEGGKLRFTIIEVYPGIKWKDTAISGIYSCGG